VDCGCCFDYDTLSNIVRKGYMAMTDRLRGGAFKPLTFDTHAAAAKFILFNRCSMCRGNLVGAHTENRQWAIECPNCEAPAYDHNTTSIYTLEEIGAKETETRQLNRDHRVVDPDELLKGLGF